MNEQKGTIHGEWRDQPEAVTLIDAHHHLWDLQRNRYPWLADEPETRFFLGAYEPLKRDYLPADFRRDAFGVERCMFASNFPVAGLRVDYDELVRSMARMLEHLPNTQREDFFWRNASAFYRI